MHEGELSYKVDCSDEQINSVWNFLTPGDEPI